MATNYVDSSNSSSSKRIQDSVATILKEQLMKEKVLAKLRLMSGGLNMAFVNLELIVNKTFDQLADSMTEKEVDELVEDVACHLTSEHYDYGVLASRIAIDRMQSEISRKKTFSETIQLMRDNIDQRTRKPAPIISENVYNFVMKNKERLDKAICHERDFLYDRFGFKTLYYQSYLAKVNGQVAESPQYMHMRIACGIHCGGPGGPPCPPMAKVTDVVDYKANNNNNNNNSNDDKKEEQEETKDDSSLSGTVPGWISDDDVVVANHSTTPEKEESDDTVEEKGRGQGGNVVSTILETYELFSKLEYTHGSPTLYNSASPQPQLASCFLLVMKDDSIEGIYETLTQVAKISKNAGGVGFDVTGIRAKGSYIKGSRGNSSGLVPMLRNFNETARYVDQGGGKRKGSFAAYLQPWHADVFEFLDLRKNHGKEEERARDLFMGLWIPNLFMKRVMENGPWTLMCPEECPGMVTTFGKEFEDLYHYYEKNKMGKRIVRARDLWYSIYESQIETGTPYMLFKDTCNAKNMQMNLGTIRCSNLCTEVIQYTSPDEVSVCTLASISLRQFVVGGGFLTQTPLITYNPPGSEFSFGISFQKDKQRTCGSLDLPSFTEEKENDNDNNEEKSSLSGGMGACETGQVPHFNFERLKEVVRIIVQNLDQIIDINYYPVKEAENSNFKHRPLGIGTQGLADTFILLDMPFESEEARLLNVRIFETISFASYDASSDLAKEKGTYSSYPGSPASKGILHPDMWFEGGPIFLSDFENNSQEEKDEEENTGQSQPDKCKYTRYFKKLASIHDTRFIIQGFGMSEEMRRESRKFGQLEPMWDWSALRQKIKKQGLRNSLLVAQMPTGTTSQMLANNESIDPIQSNIYVRRTLSGEYVVASKYLMQKLIDLGLWNSLMKNQLVHDNGSINKDKDNDNDKIPQHIKDLFKTTWEISQRIILHMGSERGMFVCQSQSQNMHVRNPNYAKITSMHFHAWLLGLKTGMYYLRTMAAVDSIKFTVDKSMLTSTNGGNKIKQERKEEEEEEEEKKKMMTITETSNDNPSDTADTTDIVDIESDAATLEEIEKKKEQEKYQEEVLLCSRANPGACVMCSS
jgi:ribonucleoside-diphosphate reductase alpha subunit